MWRVPENSISMERLDGETILINFDSGEYFSFRGPSADLLWLVSAGVDRTAWISYLSAAFPDVTDPDPAIEAQIDTFLGELAAAGIILPADDNAVSVTAADLPADYDRDSWTAPSVHANDDLVDLLVIDPIHDTSEDGWPQTRPDESAG
jgi:hypothetical protein